MKKILVLLCICFCLCGCSKSIDSMTDKLSNKILDAHQIENVSLSDLNKEERALYNDYINSQRVENKVIKISDYIEFSPESYTEEEDTKGLYQKNGEYYIKFTDLKWEQTEDKENYKMVINLNSKQSALFKSLVPILYTETKGNSRFIYTFLGKRNTLNKISYYYKSYYDNSGFVIDFNLNNNKIENITSYYQDIYYYPND